MTRLKALLMAFLLVLLGLYAWKFDKEKKAKEQAEELSLEETRVLPGISADQVDELKVFYSGSSYMLRREPEGEVSLRSSLGGSEDAARWQLKEPAGAPADSKTVDQLVENIVSMRAENVIEAGDVQSNQEIYGLNPPELMAILKGRFGKRVLSFGKENELTYRRYVQPENDGKIYLVPTFVFASAAKKSEDLRDKTPFEFPVEGVKSVVALRADQQPIVFRKIQEEGEDGIYRWRAEHRGEELEVDRDVLERELKDVSSAETTEFIDDAGARLPFYGLVTPRLTLRLEFEPPAGKSAADARIEIIQFGRGVGVSTSEEGSFTAGEAYYAKISGEPWVYRLERNFISDWLQPIGHFRTRMPFNSLSSDMLAEIEYESGGEKFAFRRISAEARADEFKNWALRRPGENEYKTPVDARFDAWLERVFQLRVLSYPDSESDGDNADAAAAERFDNPLFSIRLLLRKPAAAAEGNSSEKDAAEQPRPESRRLIVSAKRVAETTGEGESNDNPDAPYYGGVSLDDQPPATAVLSSAEVEVLREKIGAIIGK